MRLSHSLQAYSSNMLLINASAPSQHALGTLNGERLASRLLFRRYAFNFPTLTADLSNFDPHVRRGPDDEQFHPHGRTGHRTLALRILHPATSGRRAAHLDLHGRRQLRTLWYELASDGRQSSLERRGRHSRRTAGSRLSWHWVATRPSRLTTSCNATVLLCPQSLWLCRSAFPSEEASFLARAFAFLFVTSCYFVGTLSSSDNCRSQAQPWCRPRGSKPAWPTRFSGRRVGRCLSLFVGIVWDSAASTSKRRLD